MYALVSGQAALAVVVRGDEASILRYGQDQENRTFRFSSAVGFLRDAPDIIRLSNPSKIEIEVALHESWAADRSLRLTRIVLDEDEEQEVQTEAIECLEEVLTDQISSQVLLALCVAPVPDGWSISQAIVNSNQQPAVRRMFRNLEELQAPVSAVRLAWNRLHATLFGSSESKVSFEAAAIRHHVFGTMVRGILTQDADTAKFEAHRRLNGEQNYRDIIAAWCAEAGLRNHRSRTKLDFNLLAGEQTETELGIRFNSPTLSKQTFADVMRQQQATIELIVKADETRAREFANDLVTRQIAGRDLKRAAMSLCRLAQKAKDHGLHSLQLEWTERAVELAPADGWAHGQAADAYLEFNRLDDADRELQLAGQFGEQFYARLGLARILRIQGKFEQAYDKASEILVEESGHDQEVYAWSLKAGVLRDMWRMDEALEVYEQAIREFPTDPSVRCGCAAVLADVGRHSEAIRVYSACLHDLGPNDYALNGRAHVYAQLGRFDDALAGYEQAIEAFPRNSVGKCGRAEVHRMRGALEVALDEYGKARQDFPYVAVPHSGYAEVLKQMRRLDEAADVYRHTIASFPFDARCKNGLAHTLQLQGQLSSALQQYDLVLSQTPLDLYAVNGRAFILRALGFLPEAENAYDTIIRTRPGFISARHGKASVLVLQGRYNDALELLPDELPQTVDDWICHHVRGMILMRQGHFDTAVSFFQAGLISVPFFAERQYFSNALAVARLRQGEYQYALKLVEGQPAGVASKVVQFHAYAGLQERAKANQIQQDVLLRSTPKILRLVEEIARRYRLSAEPPKFNTDWIFELECEVLLEAA